MKNAQHITKAGVLAEMIGPAKTRDIVVWNQKWDMVKKWIYDVSKKKKNK